MVPHKVRIEVPLNSETPQSTLENETPPKETSIDMSKRKAVEVSFKDIALEIAELVAKKNRDYGDSNLLIFGQFGIAVRLMDKVMRLANLSFKDAAVDESIEDTLKDIAGYAINAIRLLREGRLKNFGWFENSQKGV